MTVVASRSLSHAVLVAVGAALLHALVAPAAPLPLAAAVLALFGLTLVAAALVREQRELGQSAWLTLAAIAGAVWWGLSMPARPPDALAVLTRVIGFAILGEVWLWRTVSIARGAGRWSDVRDQGLLALGAVVVATLVKGPVDHAALAPLGLIVAVAGAVGLAVARSREELALGGGDVRGRPVSTPAAGIAFVLGIVAIGLALVLPSLEAAAAELARVGGPVVEQGIFFLLLPLGYLAAGIALLLHTLGFRLRLPQIKPPEDPFGPAADAARLEEMEQIRPFVLVAVEILVAIAALGVAALLIVRLVQEQRGVVGDGVSVEREDVEGTTLRATLGALLPRRAGRRRAPAEDGTPEAALRRLYWRFLEATDRSGAGWRAQAETPAEHAERASRHAPRWSAAAPLVRAYEALRYGERGVDDRTLREAREALRRAEATP